MKDENDKRSEVKTISHGDYLKLLGLGVLASESQKQMIQLGYAVQSIVKEVGGDYESEHGPACSGGHVGDFVNDLSPNVSDMLRKLGIEVESA